VKTSKSTWSVRNRSAIPFARSTSAYLGGNNRLSGTIMRVLLTGQPAVWMPRYQDFRNGNKYLGESWQPVGESNPSFQVENLAS
jgi:hypothetical protein